MNKKIALSTILLLALAAALPVYALAGHDGAIRAPP